MIGAKNFIGRLIDQWLQKWSNCKILSWDSLKLKKETFQERIFKSTQWFLFWMVLTLWPKSCPIEDVQHIKYPSVVYEAVAACCISNFCWLCFFNLRCVLFCNSKTWILSFHLIHASLFDSAERWRHYTSKNIILTRGPMDSFASQTIFVTWLFSAKGH